MSLPLNMLSRLVVTFLPGSQTRSDQISLSVMSNSVTLRLQNARLPCPSPTPGAYSNSCPLSRWCHSAISSSVAPSPVTFNLSQHQGLVKALVFPVVMYGYKSWTIKKAEHWRIDAFELWFWRRFLRVSWTARRFNQSIVRKSVLNIHWQDWC